MLCYITRKNYLLCNNIKPLNPISAGVLENQDMLGGGSTPSKSHVWCPNMINDTSLESSCALLLESQKKLQICKNWIFIAKSSYIVKCFQKKICPKKEKLYIFEKPLTMPFQNNLIFNQEKLKMCKFPLTGFCNFFRKTCAIRFLMWKAFQKAKFYQNLTSGSGSKQRFSMLQEKSVIQAISIN